jgi:hypothetical protein
MAIRGWVREHVRAGWVLPECRVNIEQLFLENGAKLKERRAVIFFIVEAV